MQLRRPLLAALLRVLAPAAVGGARRTWTPPSAAATALQAAIDAAVASGAPTLSAAPGAYAFGSASLNVSGAHGLALSLAGASLVFAPGAGVSVNDAQDVSLSGPVAVSYSAPAFAQATIEALGADCFSTSSPPRICVLDVSLHDGYPAPDTWPFAPEGETKLILFDGAARTMRRPQILSMLLNATRSAAGPRRWVLETLQLWAHNVVAGDVAVVASRDGCGACTVEIRNSSRVATRDMTITAACNMAVIELGGGGAHVHERLTIAPADGAYLATNFDGLHSEGTLVGPTLLNSSFAHVGDDFLNVQNAIDVVLGWRAGASGSDADLVVADASFGTTFPVSAGTSFHFFLPAVGNVWGATALWNATVCGAELLQGADARRWVPLAANASNAFQARYGWSFASFLSTAYSIFALSFCPDASRPPPPAALDYTALAQVNSSCCAVVRGNMFADGLGRVAPFESPNSVFEGNIANGTMYGGLLVSAEIGWLSGNLGIDDVRVVNNTFVDCCSYSRVGFPNGQCNASLFPVYNPSGTTTNLVIEDNTVR